MQMQNEQTGVLYIGWHYAPVPAEDLPVTISVLSRCM